MPSIVGGPFKINSNEGVINFGDAVNISPKSSGKTVSGSGSFITGDFVITNNGFSLNNTLDPDVADQNVGGNV
ncbi:spore germination protein [Halalkalibacter okhensis]|uniref:Spore gernimation protein GerPF n=1 Tax=Halalkalibacter okhensis TaxID=333138 RepID=A0A0B0IGF9_9BACI|nr:spore germination protein [Halalkalibacter okhensis]KHF39947.1 spore gernimation protein GerPF [Halalkalibacter okhensis]